MSINGCFGDKKSRKKIKTFWGVSEMKAPKFKYSRKSRMRSRIPVRLLNPSYSSMGYYIGQQVFLRLVPSGDYFLHDSEDYIIAKNPLEGSDFEFIK